jgi:hypothetical protein
MFDFEKLDVYQKVELFNKITYNLKPDDEILFGIKILIKLHFLY